MSTATKDGTSSSLHKKLHSQSPTLTAAAIQAKLKGADFRRKRLRAAILTRLHAHHLHQAKVSEKHRLITQELKQRKQRRLLNSMSEHERRRRHFIRFRSQAAAKEWEKVERVNNSIKEAAEAKKRALLSHVTQKMNNARQKKDIFVKAVKRKAAEAFEHVIKGGSPTLSPTLSPLLARNVADLQPEEFQLDGGVASPPPIAEDATIQSPQAAMSQRAPSRTLTNAAKTLQHLWKKHRRTLSFLRSRQAMESLYRCLDVIQSLQSLPTTDEMQSFVDNAKVQGIVREFLKQVPKTRSVRRTPCRLRSSRVFLLGMLVASERFEVNTADHDQTDDCEVNMVRSAEKLVKAARNLGEVCSHARTKRVSVADATKALRLFNRRRCAFMFRFALWKSFDSKNFLNQLALRFSSLVLAQAQAEAGSDQIHSNLQQELKRQQSLIHTDVTRLLGPVKAQQWEAKLRNAANAAFKQVIGSLTTTSTAAASEASEQSSSNEQASSTPEVVRSLLDGLGISAPNELLVHQLILNPKFQVPVPSDSNESTDAKQCGWKYAGIEDEMNQEPPQLRRVQAFFQELRDGLCSLSKAVSSRVREGIDVDLLVQMISRNAFGINQARTFVSFVAGLILELEAVESNQRTKEWIQRQSEAFTQIERTTTDAITRRRRVNHEFVKSLEFFMRRVAQIRIGVVNFKLQMLSPHIQRSGVAYERAKFGHRYPQTSMLHQLRQCIVSYKERMSQNEQDLLRTGKPDSILRLIASLVEQIITSNHAASANVGNLPETLLLDCQLFENIQNKVQALTLQAALDALLRQEIFRRVRNAETVKICSQRFSKRLQFILNGAMTSSSSNAAASSSSANVRIEHLQLEFVHTIRSCVKELTTEEEERLKRLVTNTASTKNQLFQLLRRRITGVILASLHSALGLPIEASKLTAAIRSCESVLPEIKEMAKELVPVLRHNFNVHRDTYVKMIGGCF